MSRELEAVEAHVSAMHGMSGGAKASIEGMDYSNSNWDPSYDMRWFVANRANLSSSKLDGVNLRFAELRGADLSKSSLKGTLLDCAYMKGANLSGADCTGAKFNGADLREVDFRGANLTDIFLGFAYLEGAMWDEDREAPSGWRLVDSKLQREDPPKDPRFFRKGF